MDDLKKQLNRLSTITGTAKVHPYHPSHGTPPYPDSHLGTKMKELKSSGGKKRTRRVKHRRSKHRKSKSRRH